MPNGLSSHRTSVSSVVKDSYKNHNIPSPNPSHGYSVRFKMSCAWHLEEQLRKRNFLSAPSSYHILKVKLSCCNNTSNSKN